MLTNPKLTFMAFKFTSNDLQSTYDWKAKDEGDNPKIIGFPDSHYLNRKEGYEVLPFIIRFVEAHTWTRNGQPATASVSDGQKVERKIHAAPNGKHTHAFYKKWIIDNWKD